MNVVVSGATGFIGRYVVAELERRNVTTTLLHRPGSPRAAAISSARHRTMPVDVHAPAESAIQEIAGADVLVHLAWQGLPQYRSAHHYTDEAPAHFAFLRRVAEAGLKNVLVAGTCYEYGMQSGPLAEDLETKPVTAYGFGKDVLRRQLEFMASYTGMGMTWARLFYPYGEGQAATSLLPQLRKAVADGATHFDMSPGEQLRDFVPVEDVARHLVTLALAGRGAGVVNICSGTPTSVRSIVERWIQENGWSIQLNLGRYQYPDYEPLAFWGDPRKLARTLADLGPR